MLKTCTWILIFFLSLGALPGGEVPPLQSLSELYLLGKGVEDRDRDGWAERPALRIWIPDNPTASELAVAGDLAARINLECLAVDFTLVKPESEFPNAGNGTHVLIGGRLEKAEELIENGELSFDPLSETQGFVRLITTNGFSYLLLAAGSEDALRQTGRAFFLRWPYLWDVWGRREGQTYDTVEADLTQLLNAENIQGFRISTRSASYDFPLMKSSFDSVRRLRFDAGEIRELTLNARFQNRGDWERARQRLEKLVTQHRRGRQTDVMSYAGCARILCVLEYSGETARIGIDRMGYPKRMLTPGYKSPRKPRIPRRDFDLLDFFTLKAAYGDSDKDQIPDLTRTRIVIAQETASTGVSHLASRIILGTAGASFPLIYLDSEVEDAESLDAPILIGRQNTLVGELIRTGKLKELPPAPDRVSVQVVSQAFNPSNAVVIRGDRDTIEDSALRYFSRIFPFLQHYQAGTPSLQSLPKDVSALLSGENGAAEAFMLIKLEELFTHIKDKSLESFTLTCHLPQDNPSFTRYIETRAAELLTSHKIEVKSFNLHDVNTVFSERRDFTWEGDEALALVADLVKQLGSTQKPVSIHLGVSESPPIRKELKNRIEQILKESSVEAGEIEVYSAYKSGFFWLMERILPRLQELPLLDHITIRFLRETPEMTKPQRFYADPYRWLQELYPVDEFLAGLPTLSLEKISFEAQREGKPVYEVLAYDSRGNLLLQEGISPPTRRQTYLAALPEWGEVDIPTGWLTIRVGGELVAERDIRTDLERFWEFYQEQVLKQVYDHILKKTGNRPSFQKQPYFKRLLIDLRLSEPDYRLDLDQEIISSLEAIHDEIYFDTLDFLRGITEIELEDEEIPEDSSRYSAPGNILPRIHPSLEGQAGQVEVRLEDWQARTPRMEVTWQEPGRRIQRRKFTFPKLKPSSLRLPALVFDAAGQRIASVRIELEFSSEKEYLDLLDILDQLPRLHDLDLIQALKFPGLGALNLHCRHKDSSRELEVPLEDQGSTPLIDRPTPEPSETAVPTQEIISPDRCLKIVKTLSVYPAITAYIAGRSYEGRGVPVLEIYTPRLPYVSIPRLVTAKPTLYLSGRQHANEVCSTNYILKFAELLARDPDFQGYPRKVNFVLHPMENPDGAALAYELQKLTPFHSLHAGRYSALGIDIGYQTGVSQPLLPEAKVRGLLHRKWRPDIYLNLHGYPSHEWAQPFSGYAPYLFRDYWIPRGWFAYFRALSLPYYRDWAGAGADVKQYIIQEMQAQNDIHESNRRFYDRYYRWAARWQPHMNYLERYDGVNLYSKRRSGRESRLSERRRTTYVEETPELMDETAQGDWLDFLCRQGLTYLKAHTKYLTEVEFIRERIEEESNERIHITFLRKRPGSLKR